MLEEQRALPQQGDALSQVLKLIRLRGDIAFRGELGAVTEVTFPPGAAGFVHLHDGEALISQRDCGPVLLQSGDFVLLLHADGYTLRDQACDDARRRCQAEANTDANAEASAEAYCSQSSEAQTMETTTKRNTARCFLAGVFYFDGGPLRSLLSGLPGLIHLKCDDGGVPPWLATLSHLLTEESDNVGPGSSLMISRLIDMLVIRTLRTWVSSQGNRLGWLSGLGDERIGRALNAMHLEPARAWTVESLAETARMSRSIFSDRFTAVVGMPPLRYLTRWRLTVAADLLRAGTVKVTHVAHSAGYGSEAAFSRAFKAQFGYPPSDAHRIAQTEIFRARSSETR
ncbi:AraC family transcriptional regulator [Burkholderia sp. L27(2015)]|uniref:AraC family transcriptional regulator n=1 Tax=Burkholderia sp. L27(2015) TaxID=1641858 RepID=UPI0020B131D1|nr:AraC family transcriptional regulator [Burkholderia sp. L27(2015)]